VKPAARQGALFQGATMNTVGKILVVLNLLFALLTGGFLAIDFAARTDHRAESENRKKIAEVVAANASALHNTAATQLAENKKLRAALDSQMITFKATESELKNQVAVAQKEAADQKKVAEQMILSQQKAVAEGERLQKEVAHLNGVILQREKEILAMQADVTKFRNEALTQTDIAKAALQRSQNLLKQVQELQIALARATSPTTSGALASVTSPTYSNPPPAYVKGRIVKIDPEDRTLVKISVGSDSGVNKDNTLEVYRLEPQAAYLGRLRIVEATHNEAIGRLVRTGAVSQSPIQVGDEVASSTNR
jgi:hypothetical protein